MPASTQICGVHIFPISKNPAQLFFLTAQVQELCEAANAEVAADEAVVIANFLCNGNYAVSGGLSGIEVPAHGSVCAVTAALLHQQ